MKYPGEFSAKEVVGWNGELEEKKGSGGRGQPGLIRLLLKKFLVKMGVGEIVFAAKWQKCPGSFFLERFRPGTAGPAID